MNPFNLIFFKLFLAFWLTSSLIIASVIMLPLLQQRSEQAPLPPHLHNMLVRSADQLVRHYASEGQIDAKWHQVTKLGNRPLKLYLVDSNGQLIGKHHRSKALRHLQLMAEELQRPVSKQFRDKLLFGPYEFQLDQHQYALYGRLPFHPPKPIFWFLINNKLITFGLAIALSGLICLLLAWHLGKPLTALKRSAKKLAKGELTTRVSQSTCNRKDEFGQLANTFNDMAQSIEKMLENQQRLISDISHELRTPLTRLQLSLALAEKKGVQSAELSRIGYEAEQLEQLIAELLELSRIKNQQELPKQNSSLAITLSQVIDDAEFEAEQQNKQLLVEISDNTLFPHYPKQIARAIENLLRNAIRYAQTQVKFSATTNNKQLIIVIIDDGLGLPEQELKSIFEPFYRPQLARERQTGGWGLGLAITQAAIGLHQGDIHAKNNPPHGLKFTISLPLT